MWRDDESRVHESLSAAGWRHARRELGGASVRVLPLPMMVAGKSMPRPDDAGGAKDHADLAALREVAEDNGA